MSKLRTLVWCGFLFGAWTSFTPTASADEPAKPGERSGNPLRFHLSNEPSFVGTIESIAADGSGVATGQEPRTPIARRVPVTEGLYLGLVAARFEHGIPNGAVVARLTVTEVLERNRCRFQLSADAATKIKGGQAIVLFRPYGSTSHEIQAVPNFAVVEEKAGDASEIMSVSQAAQFNLSMGRIKQIGLALLIYENAYNRFPPIGVRGPDHKLLLSWRVMILPYLEQAALYKQFNLQEAWDGPTNKPLLEKMPDAYRDPIYGQATDHYTNYVAVSGPGTVFPVDNSGGETARDLMGIPIAQISDGTSRTILVGTVSPKDKIPWTKPEDIVCNRNLPPLGQPGSFATPYKRLGKSAGVFVFGDDHVLAIRSDIDMDLFHKLTTRAGGEAFDQSAIPQLPSIGSTEMVLIITSGEGSPKAILEMVPRSAADR